MMKYRHESTPDAWYSMPGNIKATSSCALYTAASEQASFELAAALLYEASIFDAQVCPAIKLRLTTYKFCGQSLILWHFDDFASGEARNAVVRQERSARRNISI